MPSYNTQFDLTVEDMDVIEDALREVKTKLSTQVVHSDAAGAPEAQKVRRIHDLLGRLHNQKIFYRPKAGAYISG